MLILLFVSMTGGDERGGVEIVIGDESSLKSQVDGSFCIIGLFNFFFCGWVEEGDTIEHGLLTRIKKTSKGEPHRMHEDAVELM